jgi:enamine deaminase RidA (YjgF/YER057c/UK114 family)
MGNVRDGSKLSHFEMKLREIYGFELPQAPTPRGRYVQAKQSRGLLFITGQIPAKDGVIVYAGRIGNELSLEQGRDAARIAILNSMSQAREYLDDLDRIRQVVQLSGMIRSSDDFENQAEVLNAASEILIECFPNDSGTHARVSMGTNQLPHGVAVLLSLILEI